jgi:Mg-chelatase subunit ChlD
MKPDKTEIIAVVDRSGSMSSIKTDMEGGLKTLIDDQRKEAGECNVTYICFDDSYDEVFVSKPIAEVTELKIEPRSATALLDALGKAINSVGQRFAALPEDERPEHVFFVIVTDGMENASREYTRKQILELITHQTEKYSWDFTYLGANQDAIGEASSFGIRAGATMDFMPTSAGIKGVYAGTSHKLSSIRSNKATVDSYSFDASQQAAALGEED